MSIRGFRHAIHVIRGRYDDPKDPGEISHFQALTSALSATIGLGNIAGVAIAVGLGGPGAVFWMILTALFGMSSKLASCTLSIMYRKVHPDGHISGGPMYYLEQGLQNAKLSASLIELFSSFVVIDPSFPTVYTPIKKHSGIIGRKVVHSEFARLPVMQGLELYKISLPLFIIFKV